MYLRRVHVTIIGVLLVSAVVVGLTFDLHRIWRVGYTRLFLDVERTNLLAQDFHRAVHQAKQLFTADMVKGLPIVRLYIPQKAQSNLMSNLPGSVKSWQRGFKIYPDGKLRRVKVRYRGDNPVNWIHEKKSIRIKLRKKRLIDDIRVFDYLNIQEPDFLQEYLAYAVHKGLGLVTQHARLVEVFVNDRPSGVHIEVERLDENFLRRNAIMPVNLYKGEQYNTERAFMRDTDLFNDPSLWRKLAVFNQHPVADNRDLKRLLTKLRGVRQGTTRVADIQSVAPIKYWAPFSAFQALVQSWGNDSQHNMRMISDPWRGTIRPLTHDTVAAYRSVQSVVIDRGSHALSDIYNQYPPFLAAKHRFLKEQIDGGVLLRIAEEMDVELPRIASSARRDTGLFSKVTLSGGRMSDPAVFAEEHRLVLAGMKRVHEEIRRQIYQTPNARWVAEDGAVKLTVDEFSPLSGLSFDLAAGSPLPERVVWDSNGDGEISDGDLPIPFTVRNGTLRLQSIFYANRDARGNLSPTAFRLLGDVPINVAAAQGQNSLTGETFTLDREDRYGQSPHSLNAPIVPPAAKEPVHLAGTVHVRHTRTYDAPVVIHKGASIVMDEGASLVFRNRLNVAGTRAEPVVVRRAQGSGPWGTFAMIGDGANGSEIHHLHLSGGSGEEVANVRFIGMLSVHDVTNVTLQGIFLSDNDTYDDMMHVVYGNNIRIKDCVLRGARADAIDIDISTVSVEGCLIDDSGNDAIDLMASQVLITDSKFARSRDKGISVGEASQLLLANSTLENNHIGIESKDGSQAYVVRSNFTGNAIQLNAYKKNWKYDAGGKIIVNKSLFRGAQNKMSADKRSHIISADNATAPSEVAQKGRVDIIDSKCGENSDPMRACSPVFHDDLVAKLRKYGVSLAPERRGIVP